jgi:hypothetical protein
VTFRQARALDFPPEAAVSTGRESDRGDRFYDAERAYCDDVFVATKT